MHPALFPPSLALAFIFVAALAACDNDVDLLSREAALPVVYGVFNAETDEQLVSVTKTFAFAEGAGAREAAATTDSVYYDAEEVSVVVSNPISGATVVAERIEGNTLGASREAGDFALTPNYFYRYDVGPLGLSPGDQLELTVEAAGGEVLATAAADVLPQLNFIPARQPPTRVAFTSELDYSLTWQRSEAGAEELAVYELGFVFAYFETAADGSTTARELYYPAETGLAADIDAASVSVNGFFDYLSANLEATAGVSRSFRYVQLVITGGNEDFEAYADLLQANAGITATQQLPPFSNVEGGLGLYAGITQLRQDTSGTLTPDSFDELRARGLGF